ncbi:MAG TPA: hypothetical protein GX497_03520 [Bacillus bacterium]|nr:hypothetical protein [Bacillus sp. (in: firmicutes)]
MKNTVSMIIQKLECGKSEVTFTCQGDIWEWFKKKNKKDNHRAYNVKQDVITKESHDFCYETHLNKFVRRYKDLVDEIVTL